MNVARRAALLGVSFAATATGVAPGLRSRRQQQGDGRVFILAYHDVSGPPVPAFPPAGVAAPAGERRPPGEPGSTAAPAPPAPLGNEAAAPRFPGEAEGMIAAWRLRRQLRYLKRHYRFASLTEAAWLLSHRGALREDVVVVTFDDGYAGTFEAAWPVLREEGVPATIFVTTGFLDGRELWFDFARRAIAAVHRAGARLPARTRHLLREALGRWPGPSRNPEWAVERLKGIAPQARQRLLDELAAADLQLSPPARPLTWSQVRELAAGGIDIGCHTVSHPILSQLAPERQTEEIAGARDRIRQEIGTAPSTFAFPNGGAGDFTPATCEVLRATGFVASCTMVRGGNLPGCDLLRLRRIGIGSDPAFVLAARLSGVFDELRRLLHLPVEELR